MMTITQYSVNLEPTDPKNQNVVDMYKGWLVEEIRADLNEKRSDCVNVTMNLTHDFNKASVIRASNAFSCDSTFIVGNRRFNKRGTVGTHNYENVYHADTLNEVVDLLHQNGYTIYAVDNIDDYNPKNIWDVTFPKNSAFVYGEEKSGLTREMIDLCDDMIYINQTGSVRSLNIAQCAAVVMNEYSRQHRL